MNSDGEICVAAEEAAWRALLAALPQCQGCGGPAEHTLMEPGASYRVCTACAAHRRRGSIEPLPHGGLVGAIETALLREAGIG